MPLYNDEDLTGEHAILRDAMCDECGVRKASRTIVINGTRESICMHCLVNREDPLKDALQCTCGQLPVLVTSPKGRYRGIMCPNRENCGKQIMTPVTKDDAGDIQALVDGWNMMLNPFDNGENHGV